MEKFKKDLPTTENKTLEQCFFVCRAIVCHLSSETIHYIPTAFDLRYTEYFIDHQEVFLKFNL